ncbi:ABC transporter permease [Marinimicrobium sp. ABcell2]|uniref:ABC transporter permease n=1 Tax=Marinimicrobium sp. ABcell2 TaxID=3069751 RepID=UPI0027AF1A82|nr:ABC transporter permease [Marinimicrobium sp. ABcell2]MDQ2076444.1 ABC transporter permease [Marinimicrobium sp. ABcell2]
MKLQKLKANFMEALEQLWFHKLRTFLTLLGMIFGVGAVIAMVSVGEGAQREALSLIDSMGLRNVLVEERRVYGERLREVRQRSVGLSLQDVKASMETLPFATNYSAEKKIEVYTLFSRQGESDSEVLGVTPSLKELANLKLAQGRWLTDDDNREYRQVAVLGAAVANQLFPRGEAVGQIIKVNHAWLEVVGVLESKNLSKDNFQGVQLSGENNRIYLPLMSALKRFDFPDMASEIDSFRLELEPGIDPQIAAQTLDHLLHRRHGQEQDYNIVVPAELLDQHAQTQRIFNIIMSCVAGISLLVGGIGIMNIMLATVLERTNEIGLLRAVGATQENIRDQFIVESVTISAIGGLFGIVLGFALAGSISLFAGWPVAGSANAIVIAVFFCTTTGLVFGIYPAVKASKLDPITALQRD